MPAPKEDAAIRLQALWTVDPAAAAAVVRAAMATTRTLEGAARLLRVSSRTLYRWIAAQPLLRTAERGPMKPRELRGAINRAKFVYVLVPYNAEQTYYAKISKESARELADAAKDENDKPENIVASEDGGDLYIGHLPSGVAPTSGEEEPDDDE
jgi:hypothetical protein